MKFKKKAIIPGFVILLGLLFALPATRDEIAWTWAESQDQAADYLQYYTDWPTGRHVAEAKYRYGQSTWNNTKRAMIAEAIKKNSAAKSDPELRRERKERLENFFWKQVTNENALYNYKGYLQRYPAGLHVEEARRRIDELTRQGATDAAPADSPTQ